MSDLTERDFATLDMIFGDGGVFLTNNPDPTKICATTLAGREVSPWRVNRLLTAGKLEAVGGGLFPGTTQSYRVLA